MEIIKPNKQAFFFQALFRSFVTLTIILIIVSTIAYFLNFFETAFLIASIFYLLLIGFNVLITTVRFKKESYKIEEDRIVYKSGSLFSDRETELIIKNITHVLMQKPWIENQLFQTGSIYIESAGSADSEIYMIGIDRPEEIYTKIQEKMRCNGFQLDMENLVQQERPSALGVFLHIFQNIITFAFSIFIFGSSVIEPFIKLIQEGNINIVLSTNLIIGVIVFILIPYIFRFLDLKNRVYRIYKSTVTYSEGFLNKNYAFLPMENISDSTVTQTFIDRFLSLYDIVISCQGAGQDIHFTNMPNGKKLEKNIDKLISEIEPLVTKDTGYAQSTNKKITEEVETDEPTNKSIHIRPKNQNITFTANYKIDSAKTLVTQLILFPFSIIFFPLLPGWIIMTIGKVIQLIGTNYHIRERKIVENFTFINKKNKEFSIDKITGVIIKEGIIDRWFKTCSVIFWSIGSSEKITFTSIKKTEKLEKDIKEKFGFVSKEKELHRLNSDYEFSEMLSKNFFVTVIMLILLLTSTLAGLQISNWYYLITFLIAILYGAIHIYNSEYFTREYLLLYQDFIHFSKGLFLRENYFIFLDNIKDITTTKYPFITKGSIRFNIAGEQLVKTKDSSTITSNSFTIDYIESIDSQDETLDIIFYQRPNREQIEDILKHLDKYHKKVIMKTKPDIANPVLVLVILSILITPLLILLPITLIWTIWSRKVITYILESYRVVEKSGILYKKQTSIVSHKIDYINKDRGFTNQVFKNGNVTIHTVGSSSPELILTDVKNYEKVYEELKKQYL